jgi:hypothetical protein
LRQSEWRSPDGMLPRSSPPAALESLRGLFVLDEGSAIPNFSIDFERRKPIEWEWSFRRTFPTASPCVRHIPPTFAMIQDGSRKRPTTSIVVRESFFFATVKCTDSDQSCCGAQVVKICASHLFSLIWLVLKGYKHAAESLMMYGMPQLAMSDTKLRTAMSVISDVNCWVA